MYIFKSGLSLTYPALHIYVCIYVYIGGCKESSTIIIETEFRILRGKSIVLHHYLLINSSSFIRFILDFTFHCFSLSEFFHGFYLYLEMFSNKKKIMIWGHGRKYFYIANIKSMSYF